MQSRLLIPVWMAVVVCLPTAQAASWEEQGPVEAPPQELLPPAMPAAPAPPARETAQAELPAPRPVAPDAPPLVQSAPAPVSAPSAAPAPPASSGATAAAATDTPKPPYAAVKNDGALRDRPLVDAADAALIAGGTLVHLSAKTANAGGVWWYVTAAGIGGGWLQESELGPITP